MFFFSLGYAQMHTRLFDSLSPLRRHFIVDDACRAAFAQAEVYCPELRELTLLAKTCSACSKRGVTDAKARQYFVFVMDCLRACRLTGDFPKTEKLTVIQLVGVERKTPAGPTRMRPTG